MESETLRLSKSLLTIIALFAGFLSAGTSPLNAQFLSPAVGQWETNVGFRALDRPRVDDVNFAVLQDGNTGATLLDANTLTDVNIGLGTDISFSSLRENGLDYEVRFFFNSFDRETTTQANNITSPFFSGISFTDVNGRYKSDVFNIELNQKRVFSEYARFLHGVRFLYTDEELKFEGEGQILLLDFIGTTTTRTKNPMLGYHLGIESRIAVVPGLDIDSYFKAGVFSNFASQSTTQTNSLLPGGISTSGQESVIGFASDFGIKFQFNVVENFLSFYGGYDGMYVNSFAPAPANVNLPSGVINDFDYWLHGIVFGMSVRR